MGRCWGVLQVRITATRKDNTWFAVLAVLRALRAGDVRCLLADVKGAVVLLSVSVRVLGVPDGSPLSTCALFGTFMFYGHSVHSCPEFFVKQAVLRFWTQWQG